MPISKPSKKPVYWSSLGKQPVSTRASSPTFSFGTGAAREAPRIGTSRFGPQRELVAVGSKHDGIVSPGPTRYNVAESTPPAKRGAVTHSCQVRGAPRRARGRAHLVL